MNANENLPSRLRWILSMGQEGWGRWRDGGEMVGRVVKEVSGAILHTKRVWMMK